MQLCKVVDLLFEVLFYHFEVRWLSRVKVISRVFALREELSMFPQEHNHCHSKNFAVSSFLHTLFYIIDIFGAFLIIWTTKGKEVE